MRRLKAKTKEEKCKYKRCMSKQLPDSRYCARHENIYLDSEKELINEVNSRIEDSVAYQKSIGRPLIIKDLTMWELYYQRIRDFIYQKQN